MTRVRFVIAVLAAVVPLVLGAAPAVADDKVVNARVVSPENDATLSEVVSLQGHGSSRAGIRRIEILVNGQVAAVHEPTEFRQEVDVAYEWDTRYSLDGSTPASNGIYTIEVRAIAQGERASDVDWIDVVVDNPPTAPSGVLARVSGSEVTLEWEPNPEPDVVGYRVLRSAGNGFRVADVVDVPGFYEAVRDPGSYTYKVVALRRSHSYPTGHPGPASGPVRIDIAGARSENVDDGGVAPRGLPGGVDLPDMGASGLPDLPDLDQVESEPRWGTYDETLPYDEVPKRFRLVGKETSADDRWYRTIPPDGLRWMALGLLLLVVAGQARLIGSRLAHPANRTDPMFYRRR